MSPLVSSTRRWTARSGASGRWTVPRWRPTSSSTSRRAIVDKGIHEVIENNVRLAGGQGFLTNIGGIVTMTFTIPANLAGLALIQCRMVAGILHLRGYDLDDPRVRTAILASLLGEERMLALIKKKQLPGTPMALATAPVHDPQLSVLMANEVASELISRVAGKKLARTVVRKIPLVGGFVGRAPTRTPPGRSVAT